MIFVELYSSYENGALSLCRRWTQVSWHIFQIALLVHKRIFLYANARGGDWEPVCTWLVVYPGDLTFLPQSDLERAHFTVEMQDPKHLLVGEQILLYPGTEKEYIPLSVTKNTHIRTTTSGQVFS